MKKKEINNRIYFFSASNKMKATSDTKESQRQILVEIAGLARVSDFLRLVNNMCYTSIVTLDQITTARGPHS
jgi:hypothetical protein